MTSQQNPSEFKREMRIPVEIPVHVDSVLVAGDAIITNLTEHGALIEGMSLPKGMQFQIEYAGQVLFGVVAWAENDRFGARFPFVLNDGPLYTRLQQAVLENDLRERRERQATSVEMPMEPVFRPALATLRRPAAGFGRRGL
ncbi:MAG: PilZ domain-containing protein [Sphingomonadaceae bacterium]|jgi:hypothetical protein